MGCHLHIRDVKPKSLQPAVILFKYLIEGAVPKTFNCMRPNWPKPPKVLAWEIYGGIQVLNGIPYVIFCDDHSVSELKKQVTFNLNEFLNR